MELLEKALAFPPEGRAALAGTLRESLENGGKTGDRFQALLDARGTGQHLWSGVDPDEYVRSLREGWE